MKVAGVHRRIGGIAGAPEPATWAMIISGFGVIGAGLRRVRRKSDDRLTET